MRPSYLDDLVAKKICDAIAVGNTRECAAKSAGVGVSTLMMWMDKGRKGVDPYADFLEKVKRADAIAEAACVQVIRDAMPTKWQAAAWWLERRRGRQWGMPEGARQHSTHINPMTIEEAEQAVAKAKDLLERKAG